MSSGFFALLITLRHTVRTGAGNFFFVHRAEADSLSS